MLPYSCKHGIVLNRNWLKVFRIPNHPEMKREFISLIQVELFEKKKKINSHLFPPLELKLSKINANNPINNGIETTVNGNDLRSPSNLSANKT